MGLSLNEGGPSVFYKKLQSKLQKIFNTLKKFKDLSKILRKRKERLEENKMLKRATSWVLVLLLMVSFFTLNLHAAKAQTATPNQAVITVSGVPAGNNGLAVEVTVDTAVVKLGSSASSDVSGSLAITDSMSAGVGIISTSATLPATFMVTVPLEGVVAGMSNVTVGMVLDMLGGAALTGASATVDISSVTVAAATTTTSSSGSTMTTTSGGAGGMLSADSVTFAVTGDAIKGTTAVNVTVAISDKTVADLDSASPTFMGNGATQLLTDIKTDTGVLTAVWSGSITDGVANITAMVKAGSMAGSTMISVTKVEVAGGTDVTGSIATKVTPDTITNSAAVSSSSGGTTTSSGGVSPASYSLLAPTSATGPGKVAVAISGPKASKVTLNGKKVDFVGSNVGVAIINVTGTDADLQLSVDGMASSIGTLMVTAGTGKAPKVTSASANNKSTGTTLTVKGKNLTDATVETVPTSHTSEVTAKASSVKAVFAASDCLGKGSYVNVSTSAGTAAAKVTTRGTCSNSP